MHTQQLNNTVNRSFTSPPLAMDTAGVAADLHRHYNHTLGQDADKLSTHYLYEALALTVRDRLTERWKATQRGYRVSGCKQVYYLSLEFLMGRTLANAVHNLALDEPVRELLHQYGCVLEDIAAQEHDAGLGNGGLGRLAACFLDSCASLQLPVTGYGLRYEYGMFNQRVEQGEQIECPDHWLRDGNPWELERPEDTRRIKFYGHIEYQQAANGRSVPVWAATQDVLAVPYDTPVPGYRNDTVNTLRLWKAAATDEFDLNEFNAGSYLESVEEKNTAEHITMVLYPNDASQNGKELRLRQQYFLASASLQDVLSRWVSEHGEDFSDFADKHCFQLNDTHPSCSVAELMRLLLDEHGLAWEEAWHITRHTMAYTNHTLLPEALERWPLSLFGRLLPRLMDIIYQINRQLLADVAACWPGDANKRREMSLIEEGDNPHIRMAYLAIVGSFSVNGVAALHTRLLQSQLFQHFYELWPLRFNNKTNGVTQRRWLAHCNPQLGQLISNTIGDGWQTDLHRLERLRPFADDTGFRQRWRGIKLGNKQKLAAFVQRETGIVCDPNALFDVQVKRIHEYKRQLLNVLHVIHLYERIRRGEADGMVPRLVLIGGKAAPGYVLAKLIIKLVNNVAQVINNDSAVKDKLTLVFLPDYRVTAMEVICPATELSEQISTAGNEASGTGNMKFMLNGALTLGTLDGANIEIREHAGAENFFLFGLDTNGVKSTLLNYAPAELIAADADLNRVMELLEEGHFNPQEAGIFDPIIDAIRNPQDQWVVAADFRSYVDAQQRVAEAYKDAEEWTRMSILNTAASGWFSSDRTIGQYAEEIWGLRVAASTQADP